MNVTVRGTVLPCGVPLRMIRCIISVTVLRLVQPANMTSCTGRLSLSCCRWRCFCCFLAVLSVCPQLYSVDVATGSNVQRLTTSTGTRTGGMGGKPSPCGRYLAFASDRDLSLPAGLFDLYVTPLNKHGMPKSRNGRFVEPRRLTRGVANQFSRSWSPDSKQLVFNSQVRSCTSLAGMRWLCCRRSLEQLKLVQRGAVWHAACMVQGVATG